jgi:hypothetical protein
VELTNERETVVECSGLRASSVESTGALVRGKVQEGNVYFLVQILTIGELRLVRNLFMRSMPGQIGVVANGDAPYPGCGAGAHGCHEVSAHAPDRGKLVYH